MNSLRFNLFKKAHKDLQALLADTLIQLQKTNFLIASEAESGIERIKMVLRVMHAHKKLEEDIIFLELDENAISMIDYFNNQHYHDDALTLGLGILLNNFEEAATNTEKASTGNNILSSYIEFMAFNLNHMNMEEQMINPLLWYKYTDNELEEILNKANLYENETN